MTVTIVEHILTTRLIAVTKIDLILLTTGLVVVTIGESVKAVSGAIVTKTALTALTIVNEVLLTK